MSTDLSWPQRSRLGLIARAERWGQSSSMQKAELPVVGITVPILVVLVAWLGSALALPLLWTLAAATILGLALVTPFMMRRMLSSTLIEIDGTLSTAPTHLATDVSKFSGDLDYEGWYGQMENLTSEELEFLSELVGEYLEDNDDLNHTEFGFAKSLLDKIEEAMDA